MEETVCCMKGCSNKLKSIPKGSWVHAPTRSRSVQLQQFNRSLSGKGTVVYPKFRLYPKKHSLICEAHFEKELHPMKGRVSKKFAVTRKIVSTKPVIVRTKPVKIYEKRKIQLDLAQIRILQEHNYFMCKGNVRKLQDAVIETGNLFSDLEAEVRRLRRLVDARERHIVTLTGPPSDILSNAKISPIYTITWQHLVQNPRTLKKYTGFDTTDSFEALVDFVKEPFDALHETIFNKRHPSLIPMEKQLFIVLSRLRLGVLDETLAGLFNLSYFIFSRLYEFWEDFLLEQFRRISLWPEHPTRIVVDSAAIFTKRAYCTDAMLRARYESGKALIAVAPDECICFMSDVFLPGVGGREITEKSGILDLVRSGDRIIADDGFAILRLRKDTNVGLIRRQDSRGIAERVIRDVMGYAILENNNYGHDQIWKICCHLVNFNRDSFKAKLR